MGIEIHKIPDVNERLEEMNETQKRLFELEIKDCISEEEALVEAMLVSTILSLIGIIVFSAIGKSDWALRLALGLLFALSGGILLYITTRRKKRYWLQQMQTLQSGVSEHE